METKEKIPAVVKELLEKTEYVAILTWDGSSPHLAATWGDYVRRIGVIGEDTIVIPKWFYYKTEENLKKNKNIQLLIASKQVMGNYGPGQGCVLSGEAEIQNEGKFAQLIKERFADKKDPAPTGALVVRVKDVRILL